MKYIRLILTDLAGIGLIILALLTGWIPGPGGIPLFVAGLGLLAINHAWARRILQQFKAHGLRLAELFFREHPVLMVVYDVVALLLVATGALVILSAHGFWKTAAILLITIGLGLFLGNRQRLRKITAYFRRQP
jgi:uncharacterized membrane protein